MTSPYSAKAVANYFLEVAELEGKTLDPIQIQKLVYIAHGWHLALKRSPLIKESAEAWTYGPVIADLYHEFKKFGRGPIRGRAVELKSDQTKIWFEVPSVEKGVDNPSDTEIFLDRVWEVYKRFTGIQLANLTHEPNAPWDVIRKRHPRRESVRIPDKVIRKFYEKRLEENTAAT